MYSGQRKSIGGAKSFGNSGATHCVPPMPPPVRSVNSSRARFKRAARSAEEPAGNHNAIGAVQHCAFVVTAERFREVEGRLNSCGIDYIGPIPQLPGLL